jgi:hypothetical protein
VIAFFFQLTSWQKVYYLNPGKCFCIIPLAVGDFNPVAAAYWRYAKETSLSPKVLANTAKSAWLRDDVGGGI